MDRWPKPAVFDETDAELARQRCDGYERLRSSPMQGDYVRIGTELPRIADIYETNNFQLASAGSWYMWKSGTSAQFCGAFRVGLYQVSKLLPTDERYDGEFWFFHHDVPLAAGSVRFVVPCRVWRLADDNEV